MSVADILQQMAENAGNARRQRGAVLGNAIQDLGQLPGQIAADREKEQLRLRQQRQQDAQAGYARNADARANSDQAQQDTAFGQQQGDRAALKRKEEVNRQAWVIAAEGSGGDPTKFKIQEAMQFAATSEFPDVAQSVHDHYLAMQKPVAPPMTVARGSTVFSGDPNDVDPQTGQRRIVAQGANDMTPAEQALRDETTRHNKETERVAGLTAGRTEAAQQETARHNRETEKAANPFGGMAAGGPSGADLLAQMPAAQREQSQALVDGRRSLDARLASTPFGRTIIAGAYAIDPTFDQGNYNARNKARTDLTSPNGTGGKTIGALNTAIQHAGKLSDLIEKLDNFETPGLNAVVNPIKTALGSTKVTNYDTVAPQLAKEIERVWRGAGGTAGEIHDLVETIGHNKGKQQQREALAAFVDLAKGKLDTQEQQRDTVMGPAGKSIPILYESNLPIMAKIAQRASGKSETATADTTAPSEGQAGSVNGVPAVWKTVDGKAGWYAK